MNQTATETHRWKEISVTTQQSNPYKLGMNLYK